MTLPDSGRAFEVTDAEQARLLTDPLSKSYFRPFLAREASVAGVARELGCPLGTLLYRVRTFLRAGLLAVTREERRAGRAVKHYRSVHDAYFVPFRLTPYATLEERVQAQGAPIFAELVRAYAAALQQSGIYGQHLYRAEDGVVWTSDAPPPLTPAGLPVVFSDTVTPLAAPEARELAETLRTLAQRSVHPIGEPDAPERRPYFLMVALLPTDKP